MSWRQSGSLKAEDGEQGVVARAACVDVHVFQSGLLTAEVEDEKKTNSRNRLNNNSLTPFPLSLTPVPLSEGEGRRMFCGRFG